MFTVDADRAGQTDRHLGHADKILDVARQYRGVETELSHMAQFGATLLGDEFAPNLRRLEGVVVPPVARDTPSIVHLVLGKVVAQPGFRPGDAGWLDATRSDQIGLGLGAAPTHSVM